MKKVSLTVLLLLFFVTMAFAKVNVNTATVQELEALPGIGNAKAEAIVKHREANGKFKAIEDLTQVKGVGDKILEKISKEVEVK